MIYSTFTDYTSWLRGRTAIIPSAEFDFWADKASSDIDAVTFNKLSDSDVLLEFKEAVNATCCEVAELMYKNEAETAEKQIKGYSIGNYSESYVVDQVTSKEKITACIKRRLANTGLLYRGV